MPGRRQLQLYQSGSAELQCEGKGLLALPLSLETAFPVAPIENKVGVFLKAAQEANRPGYTAM